MGCFAATLSIERRQVKVLATNGDKFRGLIVPFIDARSVMDRLDELLSPEASGCPFSGGEIPAGFAAGLVQVLPSHCDDIAETHTPHDE